MIDHDVRTDPPITPITVLTGFLGAGKTTLLNRILKSDHGLRIAVMVNDFGSINIDADLVVGVEASGDIINLANGCICCSMRDDMLTAVEQLTERPEQPQYIIVEASGVGDPSRIAFNFVNASLRGRVRLDSIICLVDASEIFAVSEQMELKLRQIGYSDLLILSKTDVVSREEVDRIKAWLDERIGRYRLVEAPHGDVPMEILLSSGRFDPSQVETNDTFAAKCASENRSRKPPAPYLNLQHLELRDGPSHLAGCVALRCLETPGEYLSSQGRGVFFRRSWASRRAASGREAG